MGFESFVDKIIIQLRFIRYISNHCILMKTHKSKAPGVSSLKQLKLRIHVLDHLGCQSKSKPGKRRRKEVNETVLTPSLRHSQAFYRLYWEVGSLTSQRQLKEGRENSY
ncbi:hypothetical protein YC2023_032582 [Brassica napus]